MSDEIDISFLIGNINEAMSEAERLATLIARGVGGREISLTITKLEEARHRAVDAMMLLEGAKNPVESQEGE